MPLAREKFNKPNLHVLNKTAERQTHASIDEENLQIQIPENQSMPNPRQLLIALKRLQNRN